jgi:hypothetical protein
MRPTYCLPAIVHTAGGPKTIHHVLDVIEERDDAVRTPQGWIDRAFIQVIGTCSGEAP